MKHSLRYMAILLSTLAVACAAAESSDEQSLKEGARLLGTLKTTEYNATIYTSCAEGEVSCDRIYAQLLEVDSNQTIELRGSTMHSLCADGQTPCRFLGYHLGYQEYEYRILENGQLSIKRCDQLGCEALYNERGSWQY